MIRNTFTILIGIFFCFGAPLIAGMFIAAAKNPDVVIVLVICAGAISAAGMHWIFQDGKMAALRRFERGLR